MINKETISSPAQATETLKKNNEALTAAIVKMGSASAPEEREAMRKLIDTLEEDRAQLMEFTRSKGWDLPPIADTKD